MAILTSSLGNLSGKLGNLVFRVRGGKTFVSKAPKKRKNPLSQERMSHAVKFGAAGKIAGEINSIPELQEIWKKQFKTKKSIFTKIFKSVYIQMEGKFFNKSGSLVPDYGFKINGRVTVGMNNFLIETEAPSGEGILESGEKSISVVGILVLAEPGINTVPDIKVEKIISWPPEELKEMDSQTFLFGMSRELQEAMRIYGKREFHMHIITRDEKGNIARFSEMIS